MKNILVFLSCAVIFIFCSSCAKRSVTDREASKEKVKQGSDDALEKDSNSAYIKIEDFSASVEFDEYKILLYEGDDLQTLKGSTLESKKFSPGTTVKVGIVFYKDGKKVAETSDSKNKCNFTKVQLTSGSNWVKVAACSIDGNNNILDSQKENETCDNYQEMYNKCVFQDSIDSNDSFYRKAIENIGTCSDLSEIICYKKADNKKVVILACVPKDQVTEDSLGLCLTKHNKLVLSKTSYSAIKIGDVQIL